jgi:hypothetical protein
MANSAPVNQYTGTFWKEQIWLPPNVTWSDLTNSNGQSGVNYPVVSDLLYPIPAAFVVILIRSLVERFIFRPFGVYLGLRPLIHRPPTSNKILEDAFVSLAKNNDKKYLNNNIPDLAKCCGMTMRQVERWIRKRQMENRPSILDKFSETGWRWLYYTAIFLYGLHVLWAKPWMWDIKLCWYNYPHHSVEHEIWWYYMIELSFYWSLCISQFVDVRRKDFWEMFIHHITAIALMGVSWTCNLTRIGSLVLIVHDAADIFLESSKMCIYAKYKRLSDAVFASFTLTWILTRLGLYPTWILFSTTIDAPQIFQMFPAFYFLVFLLYILLALHLIWTYYIFKMVYKAFYIGKTEDSRSDSEDETLRSTNTEDQKKEN